MSRILVVLFADALDEIGVRYKAPRKLDVPRFRVGFRIVDCDLDVHVADSRSVETFRDAERLSRWQPTHVEPCFPVLSFSLDDKGVVLPMANRIAHPSRLRIFR